MANEKRLKKAAVKFRRENPRLSGLYSSLMSSMAKFILQSNSPEVIVGIKGGDYYERTND